MKTNSTFSLIHQVGQYTPTTVVQTIANPDGTVSIIHVDPSNPVITLPDGTTAQVQGVAQMDPGQGVHTLAEVASQHSSIEVGHSADLQENGHIIITGDDGQGMEGLYMGKQGTCKNTFHFLFQPTL